MTEPSPNVARMAVLALALVGVGAVFVTAARVHKPGPRLARKTRLVDLIRAEDARTRGLRRELADLQRQVDSLTGAQSQRGAELDSLHKLAARLGAFAGVKPVTGPGLMVELRDSTLQKSPTGDPNDLVIHEQDIQAVVNALWSGGAEAIGINGERLTAESAIRCVGNTLLLHGSVYSPPYRISAVGEAAAMRAALDGDTLVARLRQAVEDFHLGYDINDERRIQLGGFTGLTAERYAEAA